MPGGFYTEFLSWDDQGIISNNPVVNGGLDVESVSAAFKAEAVNLWHPMTLWSHQLDVSLFGLNPDLHHLSAIFYHLLAGVALFFALSQITRAKTPGREKNASHLKLVSKTVALSVSLLFLLHPMHVESWAWLSERKDTLSALFAFLSLAFWARYVSGNGSSKGNYLLSILFLCCGLLSKPSLVIWPAILLLTSHWQNPRHSVKEYLPDIGKLVPHLVLCFVVACITYGLQLERDEMTLTRLAERSIHQNILVGFNNIWLYFSKIFFPAHLSYFYLPIRDYPVTGSVLGITITVLFSYLAWKYRQSFPLLLWAWGSYFVILFPVAGFIAVGESNAPDRYSYLAYNGPFLLLAVLVQKALGRLKCSKSRRQFVGLTLAGLVFCALAFMSVKRAALWRNMETLTLAAIKTEPNNYAAHHHLALYYLRQESTGKSIPHLKRSLELNRKNPVLWGKLGIIEYQAGQHQLAKEHFHEQLIHAPGNFDSNLGLVKIYSEHGQLSKAIPHLEKMVDLVPENELYQKTLQQYRTSRRD